MPHERQVLYMTWPGGLLEHIECRAQDRTLGFSVALDRPGTVTSYGTQPERPLVTVP